MRAFPRFFASQQTACSSVVLRLALWLCTAAGVAPGVTAQDLEPRRWTHLPVGTNFAGVNYSVTTGDVAFDPVLRIDDAEVEMHTLLLSYSRYFALFGTTARFDALLPVQSGRWEGLLDGAPAAVDRDGLADPIFRLSANLTGAPALRGADFLAYRAEHGVQTAVGVAVEVRAPLGEYEQEKLINLGQNRFVVAPQLGVLHTRGQWSFELTGTTFFYQDNDEFFRGSELEQDPLFAVQTHVVRVFDSGLWLSGGVAYGRGGQSTIDGVAKDDEKSNLLYGASFGFRLGESQGVRIGYVRGDTLIDVGADTHSLVVGWSISF